MIIEFKDYISNYLNDITKDPQGEELVSYIMSKFEVILELINLNITEKDLEILKLISTNANQNT